MASLNQQLCGLQVSSHSMVNIGVKFNNAQFPLRIGSTETIVSVKTRIQEVKGLALRDQALIYSGRLLKDSEAVSHYNIHAGTTIQLLQRQRGGDVLQIFIVDLTGRAVSVTVRPSDTILEMKKKIQVVNGISYEDKKLRTSAGRSLENQETVLSNAMQDNSVLFHFGITGLEKSLTIYVRDRYGGEHFTIAAEPSSTLEEIMSEIEDKMDISPLIRKTLYFNGKELELMTASLDYYKICNESVLMLVVRIPGGGPGPSIIHFVLWNGEKTSLRFSDFLRVAVADAKSAVVPHGFSSHQFQLMHGEKCLADDESFSQNGIHGYETLHLVWRDRWKNIFPICVKTLSGKTLALDVTNLTTIAEVKSVIQDKEGIPAGQQKLLCPLTELQDDSKTIWDYEIRKGSVLHVMGASRLPKIHIVKRENGEGFLYEYSPYYSIIDIKKEIYRMRGIPVERLQLYYFETPLVDDYQTLRSYNITDEVPIISYSRTWDRENPLKPWNDKWWRPHQ